MNYKVNFVDYTVGEKNKRNFLEIIWHAFLGSTHFKRSWHTYQGATSEDKRGKRHNL